MTLHVLAFDPGAATGWSLTRIGDRHVRRWGLIRERGGKAVDPVVERVRYRDALTRLGRELRAEGVAYQLVIESVHVSRNPARAGAAVPIAKRSGMIEHEFACATVPVEVEPASWKAGLGLGGDADGAAYVRRAAAILRAQGTAEPSWYATGDQAAAICLGYYAADRLADGRPIRRTEEEIAEARRQRDRARRAARKAARS